ncbi:MAG: four-carbon acid sugar kinase family protein, partial [Phycisphaerae bacterium]
KSVIKMLIEQLRQFCPPKLSVAEARAKIRQFNDSMKLKLVALDDDPTGCQTVHGIKVLTSWQRQVLEKASRQNNFFFVLTNSRAYSQQQAVRINREIVQQLLAFTDRDSLKIISRSDSTLRGHFAAETKVLMDLLGPFDGILVIPYFKEGGRLTFNDTHYVQQGNQLVEAHKTEFARDPVFGFKDAYLPAWVEEKSRGFWKKKDVASITLEDIRHGGPQRVYQRLKTVENSQPVIINALCDEDLEVAVLGLCQAEAQGKRFLYRSAASFVKIRAGISDAPLYSPAKTKGRGLVVVGSYVDKTTKQLNYLTERVKLQKIEVVINKILGDTSSNFLNELVKAVDDALLGEISVVLYTDRQYALSGSNEERLDAGKRISDFLCELVARISQTPDYIIAKGGITSCDVATKGLKVKEALLLGQIAPGVPIWQLGDESKYPGLLYVVFPGNVGSDKSLYEVYTKFR